MKLLFVGILWAMSVAASSCGGGGASSTTPQTGPLSGNWEMTLRRHVNPDPPLIFTGFMLQSGNSVAGSVILGSNCSGVGPVTGTVDGQDLSLTIDEFGEDVSLTGSMASSSAPMGGEFSNLAGGCTAFANTGTWSAIQVPALSGPFHGSFISASNGTLGVNGTISQGPNTGSSNATLSGNITAAGSGRFCSYLSQATITGLISGTAVTLNLFGPDGTEITQIGTASAPLTVAPDGTSLSGNYVFPSISNSCPLDQGTVQLTLP